MADTPAKRIYSHEDTTEPPPFLGTWGRVYTVVLIYLAMVIASFYAFTRFFS